MPSGVMLVQLNPQGGGFSKEEFTEAMLESWPEAKVRQLDEDRAFEIEVQISSDGPFYQVFFKNDMISVEGNPDQCSKVVKTLAPTLLEAAETWVINEDATRGRRVTKDMTAEGVLADWGEAPNF